MALLAILGTIAGCNAPPREVPVAPKVPEKKAAPALTKKQSEERIEQCAKGAREQFRRAVKDGIENGADGKANAEFAHHYNAKLKTCFYLLTVTSAATRRRMLFDVNGGEMYGEYLGPVTGETPEGRLPKECRIESFYCASGREWDVLVEPYMGD